MQTFKDGKDRTWNVQLTLGAVKDIKEQLHVDLLKPEEPAFLEAMNDLQVVCQMTFIAVKDQAVPLHIDDREFCSGLDSRTVADLAEAFSEALVNFIQVFRPELGPAVAAIWSRIKNVKKKAGKVAEQKVNDPRFDLQIDQQMKQLEKNLEQEIFGQTSAP